MENKEKDVTRITPAGYIEERVQGQIKYFNTKSGQAQQKYKFYKRLEFILAASIPVTITFSSMAISKETVFWHVGTAKFDLDLFFQLMAAAAGVVMAIISKVVDLEDFHKRWTDFRTNSEAMQHQLFLYRTRTGEYDDEEEAFSKFVDHIESILNNDVLKWKQKSKQAEEQANKPKLGQRKN